MGITRQFHLTDEQSARDGTNWPHVTYTFNDTDAAIEILRRLPNGYRMTFGPTDGDNWRTVCVVMGNRERLVTKNERMTDWYRTHYHGGSYSSDASQSFDMWDKGAMVHVIATLWMVMYDESIVLSDSRERGQELREWAESLYSAIAETLHVELV